MTTTRQTKIHNIIVAWNFIFYMSSAVWSIRRSIRGTLGLYGSSIRCTFGLYVFGAHLQLFTLWTITAGHMFLSREGGDGSHARAEQSL